MNWFRQMISDGTEVSQARVTLLCTFIMCVLLPMLAWTVFSVLAGHMVEMPGSVTGFCISSFTAACGMKVWQKYAEGRQP